VITMRLAPVVSVMVVGVAVALSAAAYSLGSAPEAREITAQRLEEREDSTPDAAELTSSPGPKHPGYPGGVDRATYLGASQFSDVQAAETESGFAIGEPTETFGRSLLGIYYGSGDPKNSVPDALILRYGSDTRNDLELRVEHWSDPSEASAFIDAERWNNEMNRDWAANGYEITIAGYAGYVRNAVDSDPVFYADGTKVVGTGIYAPASILCLAVGRDVYILEGDPSLSAEDLVKIAESIPLSKP